MTTQKDFKRLVRGRMQKTGESYTAARTQLLKQKPAPAAVSPRPSEYAKLAGMSDAKLKENTAAPESAGSRRSITSRRTPGRTARSRHMFARNTR